MKNQVIGVLSIDARSIYDFLKEVQIGDIVTYEKLSEIIKRDIKNNKGALYTAFKIAEKNDGIVFECIRNVGYKRLNDSEKIKSLDKNIRSIKGSIKRGKRKASTIDFSNLNRENKNKFNAEMSRMAVIDHFTKEKTYNKMKNRIEEKDGKQLSLGEALQSSIDECKEEFEKNKRID